MVEAQSVSKSFASRKGPDVHALKDVSFLAEPGTVHALLGVNGAGKTTMMRIICTVLKAGSGSVRVLGRDVAEDPEFVRRSIGFLSASGALYGRLTPIEVLNYFGELYSLDRAVLTKRRDYLVDRLGIREFSTRLCDQLSTGQKQRVSIARSVLHDPPVIVFDEPTAGLDVVAAQAIMEFVEEARSEGKTMLYSTHIMSEVERLADIVTVIHEGVVKGHGTLPDLLAANQAKTLERAFLNMVGHSSSFAPS